VFLWRQHSSRRWHVCSSGMIPATYIFPRHVFGVELGLGEVMSRLHEFISHLRLTSMCNDMSIDRYQ
jgi:hypothetical protein